MNSGVDEIYDACKKKGRRQRIHADMRPSADSTRIFSRSFKRARMSADVRKQLCEIATRLPLNQNGNHELTHIGARDAVREVRQRRGHRHAEVDLVVNDAKLPGDRVLRFVADHLERHSERHGLPSMRG